MFIFLNRVNGAGMADIARVLGFMAGFATVIDSPGPVGLMHYLARSWLESCFPQPGCQPSLTMMAEETGAFIPF